MRPPRVGDIYRLTNSPHKYIILKVYANNAVDWAWCEMGPECGKKQNTNPYEMSEHNLSLLYKGAGNLDIRMRELREYK